MNKQMENTYHITTESLMDYVFNSSEVQGTPALKEYINNIILEIVEDSIANNYDIGIIPIELFEEINIGDLPDIYFEEFIETSNKYLGKSPSFHNISERGNYNYVLI